MRIFLLLTYLCLQNIVYIIAFVKTARKCLKVLKTSVYTCVCLILGQFLQSKCQSCTFKKPCEVCDESRIGNVLFFQQCFLPQTTIILYMMVLLPISISIYSILNYNVFINC